jgi:Protein of unknown function (DUF3617)
MIHKGDLVMKKNVIAILSVLALPATSFAADTMRDGYWELVTTMEMPGMSMKMAPTKTKHCYTKEDVKDQKKTISTDKNCTVTDLKQSGNKVTWKMTCTGKNAGVFSGETVYKGGYLRFDHEDADPGADHEYEGQGQAVRELSVNIINSMITELT